MRDRHTSRLGGAVVALVVLVLAISAGTARATPGPASVDAVDPATQLAQRYAPFVSIQQQVDQCGPGEAFQPADVNIILDQPDVVLRDASGAVIATAPAAKDLFAAPPGSNFDLPGESLRPGCDFDRRFGWRSSGDRPMVYARVVHDATDPTRLVLQYWMYFVYNDWNNRHESDWEMAQIVFDAATPEQALVVGPSTMSLSQHYGNERRSWSRVTKVGDRPVIYPAEGSHAVFYSPRLWFGMSGDAGFGCDDSRGPSTQLDPAITMLPDPATVTADGGFGWLGFQGRWGERQHSVNDSEFGPQTFESWTEPLTWMARGRDGAVTVPEIDFGVTTFFCSATVSVSNFFNSLMDRPWILLSIVLGFIVVVTLLMRRTRWTPTSPEPLLAARRGGQIMAAAVRLVMGHLRRFLPVGALALVGGVVGAFIQTLILHETFLGNLVGPGERQGMSGMTMALAAGAIETIPVMIAALVVGMSIAHELDRPADGRAIPRALRGRGLWPMVVVIIVSIFSGPISWWLLPAIIAAPGVGVVEGQGLRASLRRSRTLTRHRRLRNFVLVSVCFGAAFLVPPLVGLVVLLVSAKSFWVMNVVVGAVHAVVLPWLAATMYLVYTDARARESEPTVDR